MVGKNRTRENLQGRLKRRMKPRDKTLASPMDGRSFVLIVSRFGTTREPWSKARIGAHATTPRNAVSYAPKKLHAEKQNGGDKTRPESGPNTRSSNYRDHPIRSRAKHGRESRYADSHQSARSSANRIDGGNSRYGRRNSTSPKYKNKGSTSPRYKG